MLQQSTIETNTRIASLERVKARRLGVVLNNKKKKSKEQMYYTYYSTGRRM